LETALDRKMVLRPKLFVSMRRLQGKGPTSPTPKTVLGSSPAEDFIAQKISMTEEQWQDQSCLFGRHITGKGAITFPKIS
jgi:hypothetical protein